MQFGHQSALSDYKHAYHLACISLRYVMRAHFVQPKRPNLFASGFSIQQGKPNLRDRKKRRIVLRGGNLR